MARAATRPIEGSISRNNSTLFPAVSAAILERLVQGTDGDALAVPQQAVQRDDAGSNQIYVVRADNRVVLRPVRAGRIVDEQWQVLDGVEPGERVVVEGFQKFQVGDLVDPVPWQAIRLTAMPKGLLRAILFGDPNSPGLCMFRMKYPPAIESLRMFIGWPSTPACSKAKRILA